MPSALEKAFGPHAQRYAKALRQWLPVAAIGQEPEASRALSLLQDEADLAFGRLTKASRDWVGGRTIPAALATGQRSSASQIGTRFGGPNAALIATFSRQVEAKLLIASESTRPYLRQALRQSKAVVVKAGGVAKESTLVSAAPEINTAFLKGALRGETPALLKQRILKTLKMEKGDRVLLINGKTYEASQYAGLTARTTVMEALNLGKADELTRNGYQFIQTSEHGDVEDDDICAFLQGKVWALTPNSEGIPMLPYGLPPWHPNCRHTFGVWIPEFNGGNKGIAFVQHNHENDQKALDKFTGSKGQLLTFKK